MILENSKLTGPFVVIALLALFLDLCTENVDQGKKKEKSGDYISGPGVIFKVQFSKFGAQKLMS